MRRVALFAFLALAVADCGGVDADRVFTDLVGNWIDHIVGALLASLTVLAVAEQAVVQGTYPRRGRHLGVPET
jgi:hypothetical protein